MTFRGNKPTAGRKRFLVIYDDGMGQVPAYIWASSFEEIKREFPEFELAPDHPPWLTDDDRKRLEAASYDIEADGNREALASTKRARQQGDKP